MTRDVVAALVGTSSSTSVTLSGATFSQPEAMLWSPGEARLLFLVKKQVATFPIARWKLQLLSVDPTSGVSTERWITTNSFVASAAPTATFLSLGGFGEAVISFNWPGSTYEIVSVRADDGQPLRSYTANGAVHAAATTDGSSFTIPVAQTPSETQSNINVVHVLRSSLTVGLCAAANFKSLVGDQSTAALGNPTSDCR